MIYMKLINNRYTYLSIVISYLLAKYSTIISDNKFSSFLTNTPTIIGVFLGALLTSVIFILSTLTHNDLITLDGQAPNTIKDSIPYIKAHIILLVFLLIISFFSAYWSNILSLITPYFLVLYLSKEQLIIFFQLLCLILATISIIEMISVLFFLVQIRHNLLKSKIKPVSSVSQNSSKER